MIQRSEKPAVLLCFGEILFWLIGFIFITIESTGQQHSDPISPLGEMAKYKELTKIQVRGRVVCLHEELHEKFGMNMPTQHKHVYGFKASNDKLYLLLENNLSGAIFQDPQVRDRELILSAWLFPDSNFMDVISMKSIKNGIVHDLYYYCVICAIRTATPGPCMCCQDDVEFVEKPLQP